jgi:hypothetical protein
MVERTLQQAKPISSAAYLVSIGEVHAAVSLLSLCGGLSLSLLSLTDSLPRSEYDLAFAISDCCSLDTTELIKQMAAKAEALKVLSLSLSLSLSTHTHTHTHTQSHSKNIEV